METPGYSFRAKAAVCVLLAVIAGDVDAVGWLVLFHLYTAHMSGNTVGAGIWLGKGLWKEALHHGFPIPCFVAGVALGAFSSESLLRRGRRSVYARTLFLEGVLLLALALGVARGALTKQGTIIFYLMAALPSVAMGLQNATLRYVGKLTIRTTYITGVLTGFAEALVAYCFVVSTKRERKTPWRDILRDSRIERSFLRSVVLGSIWLGYAFGAVAGGLVEERFGGLAVLVPATGLFALSLLDLIHPLSTPRRRKQLLEGAKS